MYTIGKIFSNKICALSLSQQLELNLPPFSFYMQNKKMLDKNYFKKIHSDWC